MRRREWSVVEAELRAVGVPPVSIERMRIRLIAAPRPKPSALPQVVLFGDPRALFWCRRFKCVMSLGSCAEIHLGTWPSGRRRGKKKSLACIGCPQAPVVEARLPGYKPKPPSQPAECLSPEQRAGKAKWTALDFTEPVGLDPMSEAAMCSPDEEKVPL